jgi:hypothetical protein
MAVSRGVNAYVGFGGEITVGTKGTIDLFHRVIDFNFEHVKDLFASESLGPDWHPDMYYAAGHNVATVVFEQTYTGLELFWHGLMGTYTYGVNTPVSGANTHTMTYVAATNAHPSISIEGVRGVATKERSYLGMRVTKATVEFKPRSIVKTTFDLVGLGTSTAAATTATFPTFAPVLPAHKSTLTLNGTALSVLSGTIEIAVPRAEDREHYGDALYKDAVVIGRPTAKFNFECEFGDESGIDTAAILALFEAGTVLSGFVLTHQGNIITGATKTEFRITASAGYVAKATPTSVGNKITGVTIQGEVTVGLSVVFINASTQVT